MTLAKPYESRCHRRSHHKDGVGPVVRVTGGLGESGAHVRAMPVSRDGY